MKKFKKFSLFLSTIAIAAAALFAGSLTYQTHALTEEDAAWIEEARGALQELLSEHEVMALVYLSDEYPVRAEASYDSDVVLTVSSGQMVQIEDVIITDTVSGSDGYGAEAWTYVSFYYGTEEYEGFIPRNNLACSDELFLEWEMNYGMNPGAGIAAYAAENGQASFPDIEQFPASYQPALRALKEKYPNWIFVKMNTGLDWNTVIANEIVGGKSLVYKTFPDYAKEGAYDEGNWFYASEDILKLYMDPRNSLTEDAIFQFEQLTYNATYHTEAAVDAFLSSTFMNSSQPAPGTGKTFANIFWSVGSSADMQVSPFHLASRVYQEQGQGTSPLISGTYPGYEGYYNYFNVKASGTTNTQIYENGLKYAKENGWNNAEASIRGGAGVVSNNYIKRGQDTLYLQKFNVVPNGYYPLYTHQYMQNISAPTSEARTIKNQYAKASSLNNAFVFKIPVFENMPETACPMPTSSNNVVLQIPAGYDTTVYLDGVPYSGVSRNGRYIVTAPGSDAKSAVVYQYNESGVPTGMYLWTLQYQNGAYVAAPQPDMQDLLTYHGFSIRIVGKSGIRFKTGISADLRNRLTTEGVDGYVLKEYGTLVMNNANRTQYPMIKGGQKVLSGMSYGIGENGALSDMIYETVNGRHRFTSVLVGLPANQYKTEFAFRGYAVLEKNGVQTIVYGPVVAKSIYALAEQVLNMGSYPAGSDADLFLRQLITDANNAQ